MVAAVDRHGFAETTVGELVALAGVSKSTFYDHFESKQDCFLATFASIVDQASRQVSQAYRSGGGIEQRLSSAFKRFAEIVADETPAASLVVVESLGLGSEGLEQRERAFEPFELMIHQTFAGEPADRRPSDLAVQVLVAGIWTLVYRCIRDGEPERLIDYLDPLLAWALSCRGPAKTVPAMARRELPHLEPVAQVLPWDEPADSPRSRQILSQRDRILRATAQLAADGGYGGLTIPAISAAAGVSNQTFYEQFKGKDEALIASFEMLAVGPMTTAFLAARDHGVWQVGIEAGYRAFIECLVREPTFTRLGFFELPAAGPVALDHGDAAIRRFTVFLHPEFLPDAVEPLHPAIVEALGGGLWSAIQRRFTSGEPAELRDLAPALAEVTLLPIRPRADRDELSRRSAVPLPDRDKA